MKTSVQRLGLGVIWGAIALAPAQASAQELSFGYQWQRFSLSIDDRGGFGDFDESLTAPLGLNFDVAIPIPANLDIVGQLDWSRWSESEVLFGTSFAAAANFTTFGGGIRWSSRASPSVTPFVQGLFGATRVTFGCDVAGFDCEDFLEEFLDQDTSATDLMYQIRRRCRDSRGWLERGRSVRLSPILCRRRKCEQHSFRWWYSPGKTIARKH